MADNVFTPAELERYNRHLIIPGFGWEAQQKLKNARVLVAGAGGLGSPLLLYLAAAGVGTIGLADFDRVDESNLQRQVLFTVEDIGEPKVMSAKRRLEALNPYIRIVPHNILLTAENIQEVISGYDVIADGTDNFPTRYLVNDACVLSGKPLVYAAVFQFEGQAAVFNAPGANNLRGPNYRDLHPLPPPDGLFQNCAEGGVLGVLPGIMGSLQALEVIKLITGLGETLAGKLYIFDALSFEGRTFTIKRNEDNPLNGANVDMQTLKGYDASCMPGLPSDKINDITVQELKALQSGGTLFQLVDVRERDEYAEVNLGGELMPLSELDRHLNKISRALKVVVYCRSGSRSLQAIRMLEEKLGLTNLYNLRGGIQAYLAASGED